MGNKQQNRGIAILLTRELEFAPLLLPLLSFRENVSPCRWWVLAAFPVHCLLSLFTRFLRADSPQPRLTVSVGFLGTLTGRAHTIQVTQQALSGSRHPGALGHGGVTAPGPGPHLLFPDPSCRPSRFSLRLRGLQLVQSGLATFTCSEMFQNEIVALHTLYWLCHMNMTGITHMGNLKGVPHPVSFWGQ